MSGNVRVLTVTCLVACLIATPWASAFAGERSDFERESVKTRPVVSPYFSPVPSQYALMSRQSVAATTEHKLLLGLTAGALMVGGLSLAAYGATATCKGRHGDAETTNACDKKAVIGAMGFAGGSAMLVIWALSRGN